MEISWFGAAKRIGWVIKYSRLGHKLSTYPFPPLLRSWLSLSVTVFAGSGLTQDMVVGGKESREKHGKLGPQSLGNRLGSGKVARKKKRGKGKVEEQRKVTEAKSGGRAART